MRFKAEQSGYASSALYIGRTAKGSRTCQDFILPQFDFGFYLLDFEHIIVPHGSHVFYIRCPAGSGRIAGWIFIRVEYPAHDLFDENVFQP
ncbi:predicted protein [Coccidioides posadasii str. Silveira]|uniref:Predicted protein n=1 Tax=Coccidioides posadasii (strain RMSCC 757 / Silveira) TaxID=443226 RepID=E9D8S8_COCPS|nr:predicted protein [Coccidioides posadasii str. Silveira]